ncbi:MAG: hypothetical protein OXT67_10835 [Zetaproteobacteria bacterium]|nr:hypothetical protein [Zetaproteobacteria bacterium]
MGASLCFVSTSGCLQSSLRGRLTEDNRTTPKTSFDLVGQVPVQVSTNPTVFMHAVNLSEPFTVRSKGRKIHKTFQQYVNSADFDQISFVVRRDQEQKSFFVLLHQKSKGVGPKKKSKVISVELLLKVNPTNQRKYFEPTKPFTIKDPELYSRAELLKHPEIVVLNHYNAHKIQKNYAFAEPTIHFEQGEISYHKISRQEKEIRFVLYEGNAHKGFEHIAAGHLDASSPKSRFSGLSSEASTNQDELKGYLVEEIRTLITDPDLEFYHPRSPAEADKLIIYGKSQRLHGLPSGIFTHNVILILRMDNIRGHYQVVTMYPREKPPTHTSVKLAFDAQEWPQPLVRFKPMRPLAGQAGTSQAGAAASSSTQRPLQRLKFRK